MLLLIKLQVIGHSMEPTLRNGSMILASGIFFLFSEPKVRDILVFKKNQKIFIKRVKEIVKDRYFMIGDNSKDSLNVWVGRKDIIGKVICNL